MEKTFEKELQSLYPLQFRDLYGNIRETCMYNGLTCSNGWFDIVEKACYQIQEILDDNPVLDFKWLQIKEKFGQLVLHGKIEDYNPECTATKAIFDIVKKYQDLSLKVCEVCGCHECEVTTTGDWMRTLCDKCRSGPLHNQDS